MKKQRAAIIFSMIWSASIALGFSYLWNYSNAPGRSATAPEFWPNGSAIIRNSLLPTLVIFAHPKCPCSKASIGELNEIIAEVGRKLAVYVVFVTGKNPGPEWKEASLWEEARALPGVLTFLDEDGIEAERFQARTSGQVNLYDSKGQLVFSGGITGARGHFGDNLGKSAVVSFVNENKVNLKTAPVFGCSLVEHHG